MLAFLRRGHFLIAHSSLSATLFEKQFGVFARTATGVRVRVYREAVPLLCCLSRSSISVVIPQ
jgi:hypothetical protein